MLLRVVPTPDDDDDDKFLTIKTKLTHYGQGTMQATRYKTHEYFALGRRKMHPKASNFLALPKPDHAAVLDLS